MKTGGKCAAFGLAIAASGGTAAALSGGVISAGTTVCSGVDCLVDIADTTMTVTMGEDHQTTLAFQDFKSKIAPITATAGAVGLFTGGWTKGGEALAQLHYLQDSYNDLKNDGKLLGVQIFKDDNGNWNNKLMELAFTTDIQAGDPPEVVEKKYAEAKAYCDKAAAADITLAGQAQRLKQSIITVEQHNAEYARQKAEYDRQQAEIKAEEDFWKQGAKK